MDSQQPNDRMDTRNRIRDTAGQDQVRATPANPKRRQWLIGSIAGVALLALVGWVASGWLGGGRSFDAARLRIAEVKRGDLVRDLSADGRVIAANSPTLYAIAAGTVTLQVVAGDKVAKGQALAVIDSPELRSKLVMNMAGLIQKTIAKYKNDGQLGKAAATLEEASNAVFEVAMFFAAAGKGGDFIAPIYNAGKYLDIFGDMVVGYLLLDAAGIAQEKLNAMYEEKGLVTIGKKIGLQRENQEAAFYAGKIASAKFFINEAVTTVKARCAAIKANDKSAMEMVDLGFTV